MAIFRCKMCGGDLEVSEGASVCTCEFCGTQQTIPTVNDEALQVLFNRANVLRMKSEFDKAAEVYEKILQRSDKEAEAYWGLILCKYGIEYVEDPVSFKRIPTCHRASYDAVTADEDYKNALANADSIQCGVYEAEAKAIDEIQRGIIALAQKEDPYDVFICYKETDENGKRTQDSVIANDIYHQLTMEGFKVFYAAITLEDKLGKEYEPYIFSALNTAKVMLSLGTKPEYFNAVWVKNEWSRFLKIMKKDRSKLLIPCYRDMDAYELPEEFAHLQAQDMSKIGFINDIVRGIKKVIVKESAQTKAQETVVIQQSAAGTTAGAQIKRGNMALEDHDWTRADDFFEEALNLDPECAEAYLGKLLARERKPGLASWVAMQKVKYTEFTTERLEACLEDTEHIAKKAAECTLAGYLDESTIRKEYEFDRGYDSALSCRKSQKEKQLSELQSDRLLTRAQQYAKGATKKQIEDALAEITAVLDPRIASAQAEDKASIARVKAAYAAHIAAADKKAENLNADAHNRQEQDYQNAVSAMKVARDVFAYKNAQKMLQAMNGYKDSSSLVKKCNEEIARLNEEERQERERQAAIQREAAARAAKKRKTITAIVASVAVVCIAAFLVVTKVIIPTAKYNKAVEKYGKEWAGTVKNASIGDTITFGAYEQDNNTSNGKEAIEWTVLDKDGMSLLLVSKYALDCQQYNSSRTNVTWETCSLRTWMNATFLNDAFSSEEQSMIAVTNVSADKNPKYSTDPGNATNDKVFLLSFVEAGKYFTTAEAQQCAPTAYAEAQGAYTSGSYKTASGEATCWWWLRSPGNYQYNAASVYSGGSVSYYGYGVYVSVGCVRPALWINLDS